MEEWKEVKLGDVTSILGDGIHGTPKYDDNGSVYFINGNNLENGKIVIKENTKRVSNEEAIRHKRHLSDRTILVSINGTIGNVAKYNGESCILGKSACYFNVNKDAELDFIYYVVANNKFKDTITRLATGTTIKNVSLKTMREYSFMIPPLPTQQKIANILSSLDDKIEVNRRINENLEAQAQALFKSWLESAKEEITIGDMCDNILDYSPFPYDEVVLINSSDVTKGVFEHHTYSLNKDLKGHFKKNFKKGDILYSEIRPRNQHYAYCLFNAEKYIASTRLMVLRNKKDMVSSSILYSYLLLDSVLEEFTLKTETRSGTFPQGKFEDMAQITLPYYSIDEQFEMTKFLDSIYNKIWLNQQEITRLASLRDTLLPKLMSGEVDVNDVKI